MLAVDEGFTSVESLNKVICNLMLNHPLESSGVKPLGSESVGYALDPCHIGHSSKIFDREVN
jgi:hypothetical protein